MGVCSSNAKSPQEILEKKREERAEAFKNMCAPVMAETNLETVKHNIKVLKKHCEPIAITLSKDGFGHGAVEVAKLAVAQDVDTFIVSTVTEGIELREGGITPQHGRILVFREPTKVELAGYSAFGLGVLCTCRRSANTIKEWSKIYEGKKKLMTYVMVDAGYIGIGVPSKQVTQCVSSLKKCAKVSFQGLVIRTTDDQINPEHPRIDLNQIHDVVSGLRKKDIKINRMVFENCPGLLADWNKIARDFGKSFCNETTFYARCSLETFGYANDHLEIPKLRKCLSLKAQVRDIRKVEMGEWIGLNGGWQAGNESFVGVVSCGFSDGYPAFTNHKQKLAHVRINGLSYSIVGEICADQILVLLGSTQRADTPPAKIGDYVTLFGPEYEDHGNMDLVELCEIAEVSPSQTLCHVSAAVKKSYKSTKVTRRNTLSKMVPKDLKEVKKEVDKELKEQKKIEKEKKNQKAKKGSKKKDEKKKSKSKRRSLTKKPEKKTHYADREGTSYEKRNSYIKRESLIKKNAETKRQSKRNSLTKRNSDVKRRSRPASESKPERRSSIDRPKRKPSDAIPERGASDAKPQRRASYVKPERTASYMRPERAPQPELAPMLSPTDAHVKPSRSPMRAQQPDRSPMRAQQPERSPMRAQQPERSPMRAQQPDRSPMHAQQPERSDMRSPSHIQPERTPMRSPVYNQPERSPMRSTNHFQPEHIPNAMLSPAHFQPENSPHNTIRSGRFQQPENSPHSTMRSPFRPESAQNGMRSAHLRPEQSPARIKPERSPARLKPERSPSHLKLEGSVSHHF